MIYNDKINATNVPSISQGTPYAFLMSLVALMVELAAAFSTDESSGMWRRLRNRLKLKLKIQLTCRSNHKMDRTGQNRTRFLHEEEAY